MGITTLFMEGLPSDVALVTGPQVLGYMFSSTLLGILIVQMYVYYINFPNDPAWIKATSWLLFLVEAAVSIFTVIAAWDDFGKGWGNFARLATFDWALFPLPGLSGLVASIVHFFFCWRIYKLTSMIALPTFIAGISLTQFSMAVYFCTKTAMAKEVVYLHDISTPIAIWLVFAASADVIITVTLVRTLLHTSSRTTASRQNAYVVQKLTKFIIETGMVTSCAALLEIVLFFVYPTNNLHYLPFLVLSKLYSNSMMATLNSRILLSKPAETPDASNNSLPRMQWWPVPIHLSLPSSASFLKGYRIPRFQPETPTTADSDASWQGSNPLSRVRIDIATVWDPASPVVCQRVGDEIPLIPNRGYFAYTPDV